MGADGLPGVCVGSLGGVLLEGTERGAAPPAGLAPCLSVTCVPSPSDSHTSAVCPPSPASLGDSVSPHTVSGTYCSKCSELPKGARRRPCARWGLPGHFRRRTRQRKALGLRDAGQCGSKPWPVRPGNGFQSQAHFGALSFGGTSEDDGFKRQQIIKDENNQASTLGGRGVSTMPLSFHWTSHGVPTLWGQAGAAGLRGPAFWECVHADLDVFPRGLWAPGDFLPERNCCC